VKVGEEVCIDALPSWEKLRCWARSLQDKILAMRSRRTTIGTSIGIGTGILMKHKEATASSYKLNKEQAKSVLC